LPPLVIVETWILLDRVTLRLSGKVPNERRVVGTPL
jgi:hypothetical protein